MAYDQFQTWCLHPGETVDIFLVELKKLAIPIEPLPEEWMTCDFASGLPSHVKLRPEQKTTSFWPEPALSWSMKRRPRSQLLHPFNQLKSKIIQPKLSVAMVMWPTISALGQIILPRTATIYMKRCTVGRHERHFLIYDVLNVRN